MHWPWHLFHPPLFSLCPYFPPYPTSIYSPCINPQFLCLLSFLPPFSLPGKFSTLIKPAQASLVAQMVKNLPGMWETWVWSLGREDLLEKGMVTHSNILAWRIPWTEEPGGLQSTGSQRINERYSPSFQSSNKCMSQYMNVWEVSIQKNDFPTTPSTSTMRLL